MRKITMKKSILGIIAVIGIAIVILVSNCIIKDFTEAEGIHVLGKWAHINYQEKCYLIDMKTNEVIGDSTFTISGMLYDRHQKMFKGHHEMSVFSGHMEVSAYPIVLTEGYHSHKGAIPDNKIVFISDIVTEPGYFRRLYQVNILRSNPEIVVIYIYLENDEVLVAVCGQSEDEALEKYQQYLEEWFDD